MKDALAYASRPAPLHTDISDICATYRFAQLNGKKTVVAALWSHTANKGRGDCVIRYVSDKDQGCDAYASEGEDGTSPHSSCEGAGVDTYFVIAVLGQMLGGVVMAIGVIVGLRLALPSLARTLARELEAARSQPVVPPANPEARPVVTLEREG